MTTPWRRFAGILLLVAGLGVAIYYAGRPKAPAAAPAGAGGTLVATLRGEPSTFNRFVDQGFPTHLVSLLTQARLVRINRITDAPEPWLAVAWSAAPDARSVTLDLRPDVTWADGAPFDAEDVVFSFKAAYDERVGSVLADALRVGGQPIAVHTEGPRKVVLSFAEPYAPGVRLLDSLPIYPRHLLETALADGTFAKAWNLTSPPWSMTGLGPFTLERYDPGQRLVFVRNLRYWRHDARGVPLPYLDRLTLEIVPDQNAELLRLTSGQVDLLQADLRPEDYRSVKAAADAGRVRLYDAGPGLERQQLWFNLATPDPARRFLLSDQFREAVSLAVDRSAFAEQVFLGAAEPAPFAVPPANSAWQPEGLAPPAFDPVRAATLLDGIGLAGRDRDGMRVDAAGRPVRFSVLVQAGITPAEKGAQFIRDALAKLGLAVDIVPLDFGSVMGRWSQGQYDAIYQLLLATDTDPAANLDWWLSRGPGHVWNPSQTSPATAWEAAIDGLMARQAASLDQAERRRLFTEVERLMLQHNPVIYFVTPHVFVATSRRVAPLTPAVQRPQVLWAADELSLALGAR
jgi:peptide/nickel transport system substrate-binding protein